MGLTFKKCQGVFDNYTKFFDNLNFRTFFMQLFTRSAWPGLRQAQAPTVVEPVETKPRAR
jgi:hypothetical protein